MKIVLVGGAAAGKTSVAQILVKEFADKLCLVPNAASILFCGGFPHDGSDEAHRCESRAIFFVQRELERLGQLDQFHRALVCDGGGLDGLAYWPDSEATFFDSVQTGMEREIQRYDWVLHLQSLQSSQLDQKIRQAWRFHPQRFEIPETLEFLDKVNFSLNIVGWILLGRSFEEIKSELRKTNLELLVYPPGHNDPAKRQIAQLNF